MTRHRTRTSWPGPALLAVVIGLAAIAAPGLPAAQQARGRADGADLPSRSPTPPHFVVDTSTFLGEEGRPGVRVTVSIPYRELHFVKRQEPEEGYEAIFDLSEIFYDHRQRQVAGDVWRHRVLVKYYRSTRSQQRHFSDTREFVLEPGDYSLVVRVRGYQTVSSSEVTRPLHLVSIEGRAFSISGVEIGTCTDSLVGLAHLEESGFQLSWTRRFGDPLPHACARAELFDAAAAEAARHVRIRVEIRAGDAVLESFEQGLDVRRPRTEFAFGLPIEALAPGTYELRVSARRGSQEHSTSREFEIDASRIDLTRNYDDLVQLAELFLDEDVGKQLDDVPVGERRARWNAFWAARDPEPDTKQNELLDEFFRRVREAARRFGGRGRTGWATDRGKVYVRYGEPDDIESIPRGFNTPAYEIWRYVARNLTFVFADTTHFGDFMLVQPSPAPY
ncbi:MAG: GWxTD domain-containing protein [Candidatus Eiseniibacteriota bacterium]|jgi:GWxTD domain-containing protein